MSRTGKTRSRVWNHSKLANLSRRRKTGPSPVDTRGPEQSFSLEKWEKVARARELMFGTKDAAGKSGVVPEGISGSRPKVAKKTRAVKR